MEELEKILKKLKRVAIAFSGGIDSSFLLFSANKILGKENVIAIIVNGQMISRREYKEAIEFLNENSFNYIEVPTNCFEVKEFRENCKDRCYYCKKNIMSKVKEKARNAGFDIVCDGKNIDDTKTYRPGNKATKELGIISPLEEANFTKADIRKYSKKLGISFWNKPSNSCLATRFPYNTTLTDEDLKKVELAEDIIKELGIPKVRARVHGEILRIEVDEKYFDCLIKNKEALEKIKNVGFKFVTLDLFGIKSGAFD